MITRLHSDQAVRELRTIRDLIRWGASRFQERGLYFGHGTDNALSEAAYLVHHSLGFAPCLADDYLDCRLTPVERRRIVRLFRQRIHRRIPAAYLTGEAWFANLPFHVDRRVLIPRSPIAELIEEEFQPWVEPERVGRILDLGTGSGCIAIACAYAFPQAQVDASDCAEPILELTRRNIRRHGLEECVEPIRSDLFQRLGDRRYDLIISNPPYVAQDDYAKLPREYHHEPRTGLVAGPEGLDFVRPIVHRAVEFLNPGGVLIVELGNSQEALMRHYPQVPFLWLEFQRGGEGVFLLTREQLEAHLDTPSLSV